MTNADDPVVVQVIRQFKASLLHSEQQQVQAMVSQWRSVENALQDKVEVFARRVVEDGLSPSQIRSRQFQLDRYRSLLAQVNSQLDSYGAFANNTISDRQRQLGQMGIQHAQQAINAAAGVTVRFDKLPVSATQNMVGLAGDGSPLMSLLRASYGLGAHAMLDKLATGVAMGEAPGVIARGMVRDGLSQSLNRMLTVARTETLRVYRESSREQYEKSGVVPGYKRLATHDKRVCAACLMADGEFYKLNEVMAEHPQGRCAMVPIVDGYKPAEWQSGPDWFNEQPPATQQSILGAGRYEAWQAKKFDLDQLVAVRTDRVWGDSLQPRALADLLGGSTKPYPIRQFVISDTRTAQQKIEAAEKKIYTQRYESAYAYLADGTEVINKDGEQYSVDFTPDEAIKMDNAILTHNHPRGWDVSADNPQRAGNSFSKEDISLAAWANLREMRAVTPVYVYSMERPASGWPRWDTELKSIVDAAERKVTTKLSEEIRSGKISPDQANAKHYHEIWKIVSKKIKAKYGREKHGYPQ